MKKIMFSDKFGLTKLVLEGSKTQTRRYINGNSFILRYWNPCLEMPHCYYKDERGMCQVLRYNGDVVTPKYKIGEKIAISQSYYDIAKSHLYIPEGLDNEVIDRGWMDEICNANEDYCDEVEDVFVLAGWNNKMFVKPSLMPHHIEITDIRLERLQDISHKDCIAEGITNINVGCEYNMWGYVNVDKGDYDLFKTPREAYAALIDKISGKGTWESNPFVFVYEFKLIN